jgi:hypothetical protein
MTVTVQPRAATRGQLRSIAIALGRFGIVNRDRALGFCSALVRRPIESRHELTTREASLVLDVLDDIRGES